MSYKRLYCKKCKSIYSSSRLLSQKYNCDKCGNKLKLKSFNPWFSFLAGIMVLGIGIATVMLSQSPIIWIGGFILGISLMVRGFTQWDKVKDIDKNI